MEIPQDSLRSHMEQARLYRMNSQSLPSEWGILQLSRFFTVIREVASALAFCESLDISVTYLSVDSIFYFASTNSYKILVTGAEILDYRARQRRNSTAIPLTESFTKLIHELWVHANKEGILYEASGHHMPIPLKVFMENIRHKRLRHVCERLYEPVCSLVQAPEIFREVPVAKIRARHDMTYLTANWDLSLCASQKLQVLHDRDSGIVPDLILMKSDGCSTMADDLVYYLGRYGARLIRQMSTTNLAVLVETLEAILHLLRLFSAVGMNCDAQAALKEGCIIENCCALILSPKFSSKTLPVDILSAAAAVVSGELMRQAVCHSPNFSVVEVIKTLLGSPDGPCSDMWMVVALALTDDSLRPNLGDIMIPMASVLHHRAQYVAQNIGQRHPVSTSASVSWIDSVAKQLSSLMTVILFVQEDVASSLQLMVLNIVGNLCSSLMYLKECQSIYQLFDLLGGIVRRMTSPVNASLRELLIRLVNVHALSVHAYLPLAEASPETSSGGILGFIGAFPPEEMASGLHAVLSRMMKEKLSDAANPLDDAVMQMLAAILRYLRHLSQQGEMLAGIVKKVQESSKMHMIGAILRRHKSVPHHGRNYVELVSLWNGFENAMLS